jgi:RNA polymerase sigma-70 factor (ECF subfamily)
MTFPRTSVPAYVSGTPDTDESLVARLAQRDERALRELHHRYAALVFGVATRIVGTNTAEEIVQDVFVTLWTKHASFDSARGPFKAWLMQITRRRALNGLRRVKAESLQQDRGDGEVDHIESDAVAPDESQWLSHRQEVIRAAVDALPDAQRQALSLAFFDELTHEQVARVLGTPIGTTKTRIRLALKRLAPALLTALAATAIVLLLLRQQDDTARNEQALKMVTASDVVPLRLAPTPAAPPDAHGNYRTRPGARVAVLTTSHLPATAGGEVYVAWAHGGDGWRRLGPVVIEGDGRSLLVSELEVGAPALDELRVTRETSRSGDAPRGPALLVWSVSGAGQQ